MKQMKSFRIAFAVLFLATITINLSSCGTKSANPSNTNSSSATPPTATSTPSATTSAPSPTSDNTLTKINSSEMLSFTTAPNDKSSVKIQYPCFSGENVDALNKLIYDKAQSLATLDSSYSSDTGLTANYQSAVTLQNDKIISIVFWGESEIAGGAYPSSYVYALNIDLQTLKDVALSDLYNISDNFQKVYFEKAFFPTSPTMFGDEASFKDSLNQQKPEYNNSFKDIASLSYFLSDDGIVISMKTDHASGDHFEAKLKYSDIEQSYSSKTDYFNN